MSAFRSLLSSIQRRWKSSLASRPCDLLFLPLDERSAGGSEISRFRFLQFDYTSMDARGLGDNVADVDRPGVRSAAVRNHASTNDVRRQVKQVEFDYAVARCSTASSCPKGKTDWRAYVNEFVEEAKASGAVLHQARWHARG